MAIFEKPVSEILEKDLLALLNPPVSERKTLDYKQRGVGTRDGDRKEFLADASSFANAQGGYIVYGMEEDQGAPTKLVGVDNIDPDAETARLDQMLRSGISPPLTRFEIQPVALTGGNIAIVLRVPRSANGPHQVTFQNTSRFWARGNAGKYLIGVDELRSMFDSSAKNAERIEKFRADRTASIAAAKAPVALMSEGVLLIHVVPFSSFDRANSFRFDEAANNYNDFAPLWTSLPQRCQVTHEGLITTSNTDGPPKPQRAYVAVFRSGALEAVTSTLGGPNGWIVLPEVQARIIVHSYNYIRALHCCGGDAPFSVSVQFLQVKGMRIIHNFVPGGAFREDLPSGRISQEQLHFDEAVFDTVPHDAGECARGLRKTLDHIANTAGLAGAPYFDAVGNSTLRL